MRKAIFSIFIVVAIIIAALTINSCTKQESNEQALNSQINEQPQMTAEDVEVYNKIMNFKKKVDYIKKNPDFKSGETMSVDSAKWYMDAAVNFTYSFIFDSFSEFYTDSVFIEVFFTEGEIGMNDLSVAYFELYDKLHEVYETMPGENKDLFSSTIKVIESKANTVTFMSTATFGERGSSPEEQPFVEGDNWMWGECGGTCSNPPGDECEDAATKIADATLLYRDLYIQDVGDDWHAYYTGPIESVTVYSFNDLFDNPDDPGTPNNYEPYDNIRDRLMMYQLKQYNQANYTECIFWEEMNFYYFGTNEVIYNIIYDHPEIWPEVQGKWFCELIMTGEANYGTQGETIELYHIAKIIYKTRHIIAEDNFPIHM